MENNKINIAAKLKNCPKGTKLYSSLFGKVELLSVDDDCDFPITVRIDEKKEKACFTKEGCYHSCYSDAECVLFPSSKMRDWNKFFKPGDVLVLWYHGLGVIFKEWIDAYISFKVSICQLKNGGFAKRDEEVFMSEDFSKASDEQRDKFISDMEKFFGGKYNPETLQVETLNVEFSFKAFDKVLVRNASTDKWLPGFFEKFDKNGIFPYQIMNFHNMNDFTFRYCIPYEGNEHLLGTTEPYKEE
uniref:hypothetical protein n=1 Tax=Prevotella sp. TaxID=59823 RepID=UPI004028668A